MRVDAVQTSIARQRRVQVREVIVDEVRKWLRWVHTRMLFYAVPPLGERSSCQWYNNLTSAGDVRHVVRGRNPARQYGGRDISCDSRFARSRSDRRRGHAADRAIAEPLCYREAIDQLPSSLRPD